MERAWRVRKVDLCISVRVITEYGVRRNIRSCSNNSGQLRREPPWQSYIMGGQLSIAEPDARAVCLLDFM